jgi:hypothetical protein
LLIDQRLSWLRRIINLAKKEVQVILFPSYEAPLGVFCVAEQSEPRRIDGFAKSDGSFTAESKGSLGIHEAMNFTSAEAAIRWAESSPRNWQVVNKNLFYSDHIRLPEQLTVRITEVRSSSFLHEAVINRKKAGENAVQITVNFDLLQWHPYSEQPPPIGGCHILIDREAITNLAASRLRDLNHLVGHRLVLFSNDPDDLFRPLRILRTV